MAEPISLVASGLTIAALFQTCVKAFRVIQAAKSHKKDFEQLTLLLEIEKCRLFAWGDALGMTEGSPHQPRIPPDHPFHETIRKTLLRVLGTFHDAVQLKDRYGYKRSTEEAGGNEDVTELIPVALQQSLEDPYQGNEVLKLFLRTRWAVHDRKKFSVFIEEIRMLINGLRDITQYMISAPAQDHTVTAAVINVDDVEVLKMISEACEQEYPALARAASSRSEALSLTSDARWRIEEWNDTSSVRDHSTFGDELEDLTVTELRERLRSLKLAADHPRKDSPVRDLSSFEPEQLEVMSKVFEFVSPIELLQLVRPAAVHKVRNTSYAPPPHDTDFALALSELVGTNFEVAAMNLSMIKDQDKHRKLNDAISAMCSPNSQTA